MQGNHLGVLFFLSDESNLHSSVLFNIPSIQITRSKSTFTISDSIRKLYEMISNIEPIFNLLRNPQIIGLVDESPIEMINTDNISKKNQPKHSNNKNIGLKKGKKDAKDIKDTKDMPPQNKKKIKEKVDNEEIKSECKEEDDEYDNEKMAKIEEALAKNKTISHELLSNSYSNIKVAFDYLEFDRLIEENKIETHHESVIWFITFYFCYFFSVRLSIHNFKQYGGCFSDISEFELNRFFEDLRRAHPNLRAFAMDVIWQIFFLEEQFDNSNNVLKFILRNSFEPLLKRVVDANQQYSKLFLHIFQSRIVKSKLIVKPNENYTEIITNIINSVYFVDFPEGIYGLTLFNKNILIKILRTENLLFQKCITYWGYILINILHESGHYFQRYSMKKDREWFDHTTPTSSAKAGIDLEIELFGMALKVITEGASEFILKASNWNLDLEEFQKRFTELNQCLDNSGMKVCSKFIRWRRENLSEGFLYLGMCPKFLGRLRRGEIPYSYVNKNINLIDRFSYKENILYFFEYFY